MNIESIIIEALRTKESELEAQLNELRNYINAMLNNRTHEIKAYESKTPAAQIQKAAVTEKRKYNTSGRRKRSGGEAIDSVVEKMKETGRFLHRVELAEITDIDAVKLSSIMSIASKKGKHDLVNYTPGRSRNQTVWGLKQWLGADGKPRPEFMFNEEFVLSRK